jgi:uncharacterized protein
VVRAGARGWHDRRVHPAPLPRRTLLRGAGAVLASGVLATGAAGALAGCARGPAGTRVVLATGSPQGVYARIGAAVADVWRAELGVASSVLGSNGSVENVGMLVSGRADVAFCAADVAVDGAVDGARPGRPLQALARVHDDVVQLVVRVGSPVARLSDLAGRRVAIGAPNSGVAVIAPRLLATVGLSAERDLTALPLGLGDSVGALRAGTLDAFFWSGGLPTAGVEALTGMVRLVDLADQVDVLRAAYPVYDVSTVPARTYGIPAPVTVPAVRNVLLVGAAMPDELAAELTRVVVTRRDLLAAADSAARAIDARAAIGTQPVALHPGAAAWYREQKGL